MQEGNPEKHHPGPLLDLFCFPRTVVPGFLSGRVSQWLPATGHACVRRLDVSDER